MADNHELGKFGETKAVKYLQEKGYLIHAVNWRHANLEIDIIAEYKNILSIVEVKTRKSNYFGEPEEFVSKEKQKLLIKATNEYIKKNNLDIEVRFDIISIIYNSEKLKISHLEGAFYPIV